MEIRYRNAHYNKATTKQQWCVTHNNYTQYNMASNDLLAR